MEREQFLISGLPDPEAARRFLDQLSEESQSHAAKLRRNEALLSDVLTITSFSPLLAVTLLQNPEYISWLDKRRRDSGVRSTEELLESLAQFSLTHTSLEPQAMFAAFRRRELLRIFLRDIRRLATIAEVTEEISNLADAILSSALNLTQTEIDKRFGSPQELDEKGRMVRAHFCVVALGKLGSKELNYSSDLDLLFLYSGEGETTGNGTRGQVTNREYFVKLAEHVVKLVGQSAGEGSAYRVDLRLRPHGSLGALALSVNDTVRYYATEARAWERQVLIRSRAAAGDLQLFKRFISAVESMVFSTKVTVGEALTNVRLSKERIDKEQGSRSGYNLKLGSGGIREIEFIAQALQLAYGGHDTWLRSPHTLISLARLADRNHITESELTQLSSAYEFLRRTEHVLQMENGLQTHTVPDDVAKRALLARRVEFAAGGSFETDLSRHTGNVESAFSRVFGAEAHDHAIWDASPTANNGNDILTHVPTLGERTRSYVLASIEKSGLASDVNITPVFERLTEVSPHFATLLAANPHMIAALPDPAVLPIETDYKEFLLDAALSERDFGPRLGAMRRAWTDQLLQIVVGDVYERITLTAAKQAQTRLAEASIAVGLEIVRQEMARRYAMTSLELDLSILALGKLGGRSLDYDSDLDLVILYFDPNQHIAGFTPLEFYSRAVELFTTALSAMTREGHLYRVDLRLRPFGSKGTSTISTDSFLAYMRDTAAIWELLAFVKLRFVGGEASVGKNVEEETRQLIHERAKAVDPAELIAETRRVRLALEKQRATTHRPEIDIKYGPGGMLDVYFATRYLQLRDNVPDVSDDRSTRAVLATLRDRTALNDDIYAGLAHGYEFLSALDHGLRLTIGRTTRVPTANQHALDTIANRMDLDSAQQLLEKLTMHRLQIRESFDRILPE